MEGVARKTPPQKPVYPKQEPPRRPKPTRPVYPPSARAQTAPRRGAEKRVIFDYDKETARAASARAQTGKTGQTAAPFVNLSPPAPEGAPRAQTGFSAGAGRPEREQRETVPQREPLRAAPPDDGRTQAVPHSKPPGASQRGRTAQRPVPPASSPPSSPRRQAPHPSQQGRTVGAVPPAGAQPPRPGRAKKGKRPPKKRPPKQPPRPLTPRQLRSRRIRRAVLAGLLAVILLGVGLWASATVLFKISEITVEMPEGEVVYDTNRITAAFGHAPGDNLFGFSANETQQNIAAALPYLETVKIRRRLPDTVIIAVTPAVEASVVESASGWAVLSQSYKVLRLEAGPPEGLVRIDGVQADAPSPGQPVKLTEEDKLPILQTLLENTAAQGLAPIDEIDLSNTLEISFLYQGRIRIVLGTSNDLDYKLKWAWRMVTPGETSDSLGESDRGTLDVSARGEDGLGRARWRAGVL